MAGLFGTAFAPAKVNLFLHVGAPDAEGYHPLASLLAFADVGDRVSVAPGEAMGFRVGGPFAGALAAESDNLVARAARGLLAAARRPVAPVELLLEKNLPIAAGLGGGSSDAGATLRLLRRVWELPLDDAALQVVAAGLGADGAACLWGAPVMAQGRGERLSPAPRLPEIAAVLVNPGVPAATGAVYRKFDDLGRFGALEAPHLPDAFDSVEEVAAWLSLQRNDLEPAAIDLAPEIGDVLAALTGEGETLLARMSGSGATCFALCPGDFEAEQLAERLQALRPDWWVRRCRLGGPWPEDSAPR